MQKMIGFVAPDGKFTPSTYEGYQACAESLCLELFHQEHKDTAEEFLLCHGFIGLTPNGASMMTFKTPLDKMTKYTDNSVNVLTSAQLQFLEDHEDDWLSEDQAQDVDTLIEVSDYLRTLMKGGN